MTAKLEAKGIHIHGGKMSMNGDIEIKLEEDLLLHGGELKINDPQIFAQAVLELAKSTTNITALGAGVIKILTEHSMK